MAYMSQEMKSKIAPVVKAAMKKYGVKGSLAVRSHRTLVLNIKEGNIDFIEDFTKDMTDNGNKQYILEKKCIDVNPYHYQNQFTGKAKTFLTEVIKALNNGNHDRSDIQSDYFDVGWYVDINIGKWNKPYEYTGK